jgi:hypothetical protein
LDGEYNQPRVFFKIVGRISDVQKIASGKGLRERRRLRKLYGGQRWRKLRYAMPKCTGTKRMALAQESSRSSGFWKSNEAN